ncbi:MAG: glycosyltransferase family 2 protein [Chloroflexi bacterium]|nr:glycosyltransferase family 2 protein [Chloroflexota bacterium]
MSAPPDLSVVVLNYNTRHHLRRCLDSIRAEGSTSLSGAPASLAAELWVVDNRSRDGSAEMVAREYPWANLVRSPRNGGFAHGNNQALRQVRGRAVLLLNPDTELEPGAFEALLRLLKAHPEAGAIGPRLLRDDGTIHRACRRAFPRPEVALFQLSGLSQRFAASPLFGRYNLTNLPDDAPAEVDAICGACMLVRREAMDQVGLLDERFFMYAEDIDWCWRLKQAGWTVRYEPSIVVRHQHGAAGSGRRLATTYHFYHAMDLFYRKHYARSYNLAVGTFVLVGVYCGLVFALLRQVLDRDGKRRAGH